MKKSLSILLIAVLTVTAFMAVPLYPSAAATGGDDPGNVRFFSYGSWSSPDMVVYNDDMFKKDPAVYDPQLAVMSIALASASCNSYRVDESTKYTRMSRNAYEYLGECGFSDIYVNDDYKVKPDGTKAPAIFAHKTIVDNGKKYTLVALVPKGGAYEAEYHNIAKSSKSKNDTGDFAYLDDLKNKTLASARKYLEDYGIKGEIKVWLPGYSRGGGVANLMAAAIIDDTSSALGSRVKLADRGLYSYSLSSYRAAEASKDLQADRYDCIHSIISDADLIVNFPWELMGFGLYGDVIEVRSLSDDKDECLRLLSINAPGEYNSFINGGDPDGFTPMKIDLEALLSGSLSVTPDPDSYLPKTQDEFIGSVMDPVISLFGEKSSDTRSGYYRNYQDAMTDFVIYYHDYKFPDSSVLLDSKTAIPFALSAYISALADKCVQNSSYDRSELTEAAENAFNALANIIEDENGNFRIKSNTERLRNAEEAYKLVRRMYFSVNREPEVNSMGIPQKYSLRTEIRFNSIFAENIHKLSAWLYSQTINDVLTAQGVDAELKARMTSQKDSFAMSRVMAHLLFDNAEQSGSIRPIDPDNEQFKQLATVIGNFNRYDTLHYVETDMSWLEAGSGLYADFEGLTEDQTSGYRRVYIGAAGCADVTGTVRDESGSTVASFKNGRILSRTDGWIGYTASDNGGWLRLPLTHSYTVELKTSKDTSLDIKLAEYSVDEGGEVRTEEWKALKTNKKGSAVLSVPAIAAGESGYALPSDVKYEVSVSGGSAPDKPDTPDTDEDTAYSNSVPKVKSVRAKASRGAVTASWKKLKTSQRRLFSNVEVQYSTSRDFSSCGTIDVSKNKRSVKIRGLQKGTTYYVRVRNVNKAAGKKYVSGWSAVKKTRVR